MLNQVLKPANLVERIQDGDTSAETEFIVRYSRSLFLLLLKRTAGDRFAADECCQEAFIIALRKMRSGEIREPEKIGAFLRQTALFVLVGFYRKQSRFVPLDQSNSNAVPDSSKSIVDSINHDQIRATLTELIHTLPKTRDREILNRYYLLEEDKQDICKRLNLTAVHFDRVLYRAKKRVRAKLKSQSSTWSVLKNEIDTWKPENE